MRARRLRSESIWFVTALFLSLPALPHNARAASCSADRVVRLDDEPDDPLMGAPIQTQDGLGTCASNTLSLLLEAQLPGHPHISFLDIAFHDPDLKGLAFGADGKLAFTGSQICQQFYEMRKEAGGVCRREQVPLESAQGVAQSELYFSSEILRSLLEAAGTLFDVSQAESTGRAELLNALGRIQEAQSKSLLQSCGLPRKGTSFLEQVLTTEAKRRRTSDHTPVATDEEISSRVQSFYEEIERLARSHGSADLWMKSDPQWIEQHLKSELGDLLPPVSTTWAMDKLYFEKEVELRFSPIPCAKESWSNLNAILQNAPSTLSCPAPPGLDPALDLIRDLVHAGMDPEPWLSALPQASQFSDATNFFEHLVAPGCTTNRIPISNDLYCGADWIAPALKPDRASAEWQKTEGEFHNQLESALVANRPLGITLCSAVLKDFTLDSFNGIEGCPGTEHSSHALTIIGFRDRPDPSSPGSCRREILLQNSWGMDWCRAQGDLCTEDGKLWVPENALARNTLRVDSIKPLNR